VSAGSREVAAVSGPDSIWRGVVGQPAAIAFLTEAARDSVHAYLFVGPPGCTKYEAARAFASLVLDPTGEPDSRVARLALAGEHPDVREVRRVGAAISKDQADEIVHLATLTPVEGQRKVLILDEFHLLRPEGAARLLKTIEEPPASTVFVILADDVPHDLVTIASRCVRVDFRAVPEPLVAEALQREGHAADAAIAAARAAAGNLDRARLLAADPAAAERIEAFSRLPYRLDGTGHAVCLAVDELVGLIDAAAGPLRERHAREAAVLQHQMDELGERGSGQKRLDERHKRELRRLRTDELKAGLATVAATYRDALVSGGGHHASAAITAVHDLHESIEMLERNPNEHLLLQALFLRLPAF
jgi:DNA polymerase III subunit delta'